MDLKQEKFHAHVTLARNARMNTKEFEGLAIELNKKPFHETFNVHGLSVMQSTLTRKGPRHEEIAFIPFKEEKEKN